MTDTELVKILNKLIHLGDAPIGKDYGVIIDKQTLKEALDLINRQQAEIERMKQDLTIDLEGFASEYDEKIKSEARKECIEKVKETSNKTQLVCSGALVQTDYTITEEKLDNLLKEMG